MEVNSVLIFPYTNHMYITQIKTKVLVKCSLKWGLHPSSELGLYPALHGLRGCKQLYDSVGFSYVVRHKNGETTKCRGSAHNKHIKRNARIGQLGENFQQIGKQHSH